jgi:hypothetical protein
MLLQALHADDEMANGWTHLALHAERQSRT